MATNPQTNLDVIIRGVDQLSPELAKMESKVIRVVGAIGASLAALRAISFPVLASARFEREMANVQKTTNFTRQEMQRLSKEILNLSLNISTSAEDLAKVAAAAGQQGLGREGVDGILKFTDSVSRMASVLDLEADEAATQIGKIANIFKVPFSDLERVVAAFNQTSNNTTASGRELLDVVRRIGDASGTINLQQSIGLAASALDFGVSPEQAGTNISKVFATMLQKSEEFGKRLGMSSQEWANLVSANGIEGFKRVLDYLRTLDKGAQADAIGKLFGGGARGASLINKFVQDANNAVLDRDLRQSTQGYAEGTSALREQATVQNTVTEQAKTLFNVIKKDAIEAGDQLRGGLLVHIRELSAAFQSPGAQQFINALVGSLGDVLELFSRLMKTVSGLNVNWENFIRLTKAFLLFKIADVLAGAMGKLPGIQASLNALADTAAQSGTKTAAANKANAEGVTEVAKAWRTVKAAVTEYRDQLSAAERATNAQAAATFELARAQEALSTAKTKMNTLEGPALGAEGINAAAAARTAAAKDTLVQTQDAQAAQALKTYATFNAKVEAVEIEHQARLADIQTTYEARRQAAIALGRNKAGAAAKLEAEEYLAAATAQEEKRYSRSLTSTNTYYKRKLTEEVQGYEASLTAQSTYLAEMEAREAKVRERMATRVNRYQGAQEDVGSAGLLVVSAEGASAAAKAANAGATAMQKLALAVTVLRSGLQLLARVALGAFFWVTILYTAADALGLVEKAGKWFGTLAESIGLTSKAMRDKKVHDAALLEATRAQTAALQEQVDAYDKLKDAGKFTPELADSYARRAGGSSDTSERERAMESLGTAAAGSSVEFERLQKLIQERGTPQAVINLSAEIEAQKAEIEQLRKDQLKKTKEVESLARYNQAGSLSTDIGGVGGGAAESLATRQLAALKASVAEAEEKLKGLELQFGDSADMMNGKFDEALKVSAKNAKEVAGAFAQLYSPQSAGLAKQYFPELIKQMDAASAASETYRKALNDQKQFEAGKDADNKEKAAIVQKEVDDANAALVAANARVSASQANLHKVINETIASGTVTEETQLNALKLLDSIVNKSGTYLQNQLKGIGLAQFLAMTFTAAAATQDPRKPNSGDGAGGTGLTAGQKNREAKARIRLENARIEAETALAREGNDQLLAEDQRLYDRGLIALQKYFDDRERMQQVQIDNDIAARRRELAEVRTEIGNVDPKDNASRLEYEAQIVKLDGEIKVLEAHRAAITADNQEAMRQAREAFQDQVTSEANKAFQSLALVGSGGAAFQSALDEQLAQVRKFLAQLDAETQAAMKKGDIALAERLQTVASAIKAQAAEAAFEGVLQGMNADMELTTNAIAQYQRKLSIMRGEGALTSMEAEAAYNEAIKQNLVLLQEKLKGEEALLEVFRAQGAAGEEQYRRQAQAVNEVRLQIAELGAQANQTAKDFNQSITDDIAGALANLKPTISSLKDTVLSFIRDIAQQMQTALAKNFAEEIMGKITNKDSSKGPGGWFQSLLQGGKDTSAVGAATQGLAAGALGNTPDGTALNPIHTVTDVNPLAAGGSAFGSGAPATGAFGGTPGLAGTAAPLAGVLGAPSMPGATPATPLYTMNVGAPGGGGGLAGTMASTSSKISPDASAITSAVKTTGAQQVEAGGQNFEWSTGMTVASLGVVAGAMNGNKAQMITSLLMLGTQIVTAIWGAGAMTATASAAHTGGVIGSTSLRTRSFGRGAFAHATRYHTGGVVGLQPNEVPIIAKKGEEMITESDPRHRNNGGGMGGGGGGPVQVAQTLVFDTQAAAKAILTGENLMTAIKPNVKAMRTLLGVKD